MNKNESRVSQSGLSRRQLLLGAARTGAAITLSQILPNEFAKAFAQNVVKGKEKLIVRSLRPEDLETPVGLLKVAAAPVASVLPAAPLPAMVVTTPAGVILRIR